MEEPKRKTPFEAYAVECGVGWRGLYQPLIDLCNARGIIIQQVKEKFGGLCFYVSTPAGVNDINLLIAAAEEMSYHTCEECGEHGYRYDSDKKESIPKATTEASETSYWIRTLCAPCREARNAKRRAETEAFKLKQEAIKNDNLDPVP